MSRALANEKKARHGVGGNVVGKNWNVGEKPIDHKDGVVDEYSH